MGFWGVVPSHPRSTINNQQSTIHNKQSTGRTLAGPMEGTPFKHHFVTVIDHTTGPEHQLLFFKGQFLSKDHPDRAKMARFAAKLRKLGLREETIGYGPTKEQWEACNRDSQ